jgi:hypothetical protein
MCGTIVMVRGGVYYYLNGEYCSIVGDVGEICDVYSLVIDDCLDHCSKVGGRVCQVVCQYGVVMVHWVYNGMFVGVKCDKVGVYVVNGWGCPWGGLVRWCDYVSIEGLL